MMNPMMLMQMLKGGKMNPQQLMGMFGNNPMFGQAQKMLSSGGNPRDIIMNVAKEKGIPEDKLQEIANQMGIKF